MILDDTSYAIEGLSPAIFNNPNEYIRIAREGISGKILKQAITVYGHRPLFVSLLGISPSNLSRHFRKKRLKEDESEKVLDLLHVFHNASKVFDDTEKAQQWMNSAVPALGNKKPIELCDTFKGREIVENILHHIAFGEFI